LVSAFSAESAWKQISGEAQEELPGESVSFILVYKVFCEISIVHTSSPLHLIHTDWANGASMDMDWNKLKVHKRSYMDIVKEKLGSDENGEHPEGLKNTFKRLVGRGKEVEKGKLERKSSKGYTEQFVTDQGQNDEQFMSAILLFSPLTTTAHFFFRLFTNSLASNPSRRKPTRNSLPRHIHRYR
jgi:hypothetical protein